MVSRWRALNFFSFLGSKGKLTSEARQASFLVEIIHCSHVSPFVLRHPPAVGKTVCAGWMRGSCQSCSGSGAAAAQRRTATTRSGSSKTKLGVCTSIPLTAAKGTGKLFSETACATSEGRSSDGPTSSSIGAPSVRCRYC